MCAKLEVSDQNPWRNNLSKLATFDLILQRPHNALIYAHLSRNFVVAICAVFPQIFGDFKVKPTDFFTFRMNECKSYF